MSLSVNYVVILIIAIIILLAVVIFLLTGQDIGGEIGLQNRLRMCCSKFIANDCDWSLSGTIICDEETFESIGDLAIELNMNEDQVKTFCGC